MKTDYSVECEVCGSYNISPVKCEECWKKEILKQVQDILDKWFVENSQIAEEQERILKIIDELVSKNRQDRSWNELTERERGIENGFDRLKSKIKGKMKTKEFDLSEKIFWIDGKKEPNYQNKPRLYAQDVKEFIRLLKEKVYEGSIPAHDIWFMKIIDKLAGKLLVKGEK